MSNCPCLDCRMSEMFMLCALYMTTGNCTFKTYLFSLNSPVSFTHNSMLIYLCFLSVKYIKRTNSNHFFTTTIFTLLSLICLIWIALTRWLHFNPHYKVCF